MINILIILVLVILINLLLKRLPETEKFSQCPIDNTYVINLAKDKERMNTVSKELRRENINFKRFNAIYGKDLNLKSQKCKKYFTDNLTKELKPGQLGCSMSHITIWEEIASKNNNNLYMILEDDAIVPKNFNKDVMKYIKEMPKNWDMLLLGANRLIGKKYSENLLYTDRSIKRNGNYGLYAYIIKPKTAEKLLKTCEKMDKTIDHYLNKNFYINHNVFFCNPHFVSHNYDYHSNLFNRVRSKDASKNNIIKVI
tara:strand:- start:129 stop:893 length:765 start_codon:yes stop_codon:yes gene_type:complete